MTTRHFALTAADVSNCRSLVSVCASPPHIRSSRCILIVEMRIQARHMPTQTLVRSSSDYEIMFADTNVHSIQHKCGNGSQCTIIHLFTIRFRSN